MDKHEVVIAGGGPTGLMLAGELALAGVDVAVVERRPNQDLPGSRAGGLHSRTIEVLDQRGIADRFLAAGKTHPVATFAGGLLPMADFPTRHPYLLALWQSEIEAILASWVESLPVTLLRGREVAGFSQDEAGARVTLADGAELACEWLVGCDGARSLVRKAAGIDFPGWDASVSNIIAEVQLRDEPPAGVRHDDLGLQAIGPMGNGRYRAVLTEPAPPPAGGPTLDYLKALLTRVYGTDFGVHSPNWLSRFTDATRQAATYRAGRVLLAGDAAHIHYPAGGQGLNIGVQDAVNLGWKLAQVVKGVSPPVLLDSYEAERHPVAARVLRNTMAQTVLNRPDPRIKAMGGLLGELTATDQGRRLVAGMISGLDIHYDLGEGHPLLGRRMPDLELRTDAGPVRVFELLHRAQPVLIRFDGGAADVGVREVAARYDGPWELPVIGAVSAPAAVLVRPDGHVAWVGDSLEAGLPEAAARWFRAA